VRNPILIAYSPVREVESLTWDVSIGIGSVVSRQPVTNSGLLASKGLEVFNSPGLNKNLLGTIGCTGCCGCTNVGRELFEGMVGAKRHAPKGAGGVNGFLARNDMATRKHGRVVCRRSCGKEHGRIFCLAGGRMDAVCIPGIGRGSGPRPNVGGSNVVLQGGISKVVIGGRVGRRNEIGGRKGKGGRGMGEVAYMGVGVHSRLIGSAKEVLGRKRSHIRRGTQNPTLGRLGPRIR
jgi:hypothetical protein